MVIRVRPDRPRLLADLMASANGNTARVLLYHSISIDPIEPLSVTPDNFRRQMEIVAQSGIPVLSGSDLLDTVAGRRPTKRGVCITFDDGFEDFQTAALPVLQDHGFAAVLFVCSGLAGTIGQWSTWSTPRRFLDWDELRALTAGGIEIGSHGVNHVRFGELTGEELDSELGRSREVLAHEVPGWFDTISYPYGDISTEVLTRASATGYRAGFAVGGLWGNHPNTNPFALRRTPVISATPVAQIRDMLTSRDDRNQITRSIRQKLR